MLIPGLVSVTFRQKTPQEICSLCERTDLAAVEWGGDVHVPCGNLRRAAEVRRMSADHGLIIPSYGSYYRLTQPMDGLYACLDTACELGTGVVRIWGGVKGSCESQAEHAFLTQSLIRCAEAARARALTLALEYHAGTLTDERHSVLQLLEDTSAFSDCLSVYWQPRFDRTPQERILSLAEILPRLAHVHAFSWIGNDGRHRLPLEAENAMWREVLSLLAAHTPDNMRRCVLLEFVQKDSPESLLRDAAALNTLLKQIL